MKFETPSSPPPETAQPEIKKPPRKETLLAAGLLALASQACSAVMERDTQFPDREHASEEERIAEKYHETIAGIYSENPGSQDAMGKKLADKIIYGGTSPSTEASVALFRTWSYEAKDGASLLPISMSHSHEFQDLVQGTPVFKESASTEMLQKERFQGEWSLKKAITTSNPVMLPLSPEQRGKIWSPFSSAVSVQELLDPTQTPAAISEEMSKAGQARFVEDVMAWEDYVEDAVTCDDIAVQNSADWNQWENAFKQHLQDSRHLVPEASNGITISLRRYYEAIDPEMTLPPWEAAKKFAHTDKK